MRESWTDERLDLLNKRIDRRFEEVDRRFEEMGRRLDRVEETQQAILVRLDSIQRAMIYGVVTLTGGMIAGFSAVVALVATQT